MNENTQMIISLYDGKRTSSEIAKIVGLSPRYVRKVATKLDLERLWIGARYGEKNHQFVSGRRIDLDGYVLVTAPKDHPYARHRPHRKCFLMFEHRLVMEKKLGRYLLPLEVVDHKDGLTLHNDPLNLQFFDLNKYHFQATIAGCLPRISVSGLRNIKTKNRQSEDFQQVDTYYRRRERGDIRLKQILLAALSLGINSPFLLGTHHHLEKLQIDFSSRSTLELALVELNQRWEQALAL